MTDEAPISLDDVHRNIGRNLLRFQQIEAGIKAILPYIHPHGHATGIEGVQTFQKAVATKTLGMLIKDLDQSIEVSSDILMQHARRCVAARNELVHHFFDISGVDLTSSSGIRAAIDYAGKQFEDAEVLLTLVLDLNVSILTVLKHEYLNDNPAFCRRIDTIIEVYPSLRGKSWASLIVGEAQETMHVSPPTSTTCEVGQP